MTVIDNFIPPWQQKCWQLLCNYIEQKRLPQALLISGPVGLGKFQLAQQFANALLCFNLLENGQNCGTCDACLLIKAETHPDLILINPIEGKNSISINQIRQLVSNAYLKPQFDTYRVAVINPAETVSASAANAFLKCLEEPTERTIFILVTSKPNRLPATILSRCQKISVAIADKQCLVSWLKDRGVHENQETLLNLVGNSILTAQQITSESIIKQRMDCFNDWMAIADSRNYPGIVSEKWIKVPQTELLNWLLSWVSDLIKCLSSVNHNLLINQDLAKPIRELARRLQFHSLYQHYDNLLLSRHQIGTQLNFQSMIEEILVQWHELHGRFLR
jgi:DNA polymerase III subunit delta'